MVGAEIAVGYMFAWLVRKARRVGDRADAHIDAALDAGVDRAGEKLHQLVAGRLSGDAALERLTTEAQQLPEAPSERTAQRVALALEAAAEDDPDFGAAVEDLVRQLQEADRAAGSSVASARGVVVNGDVKVRAKDNAFAAGVVTGNVNIGNPPAPGKGQ
ncbi:MAG: chromosome partitioning protein [Catenulispora sp.]|nr:chromosome partitioning protein [Catenulispora sp.]